MNPFSWPREHFVAWLLIMLLGAIVGCCGALLLSFPEQAAFLGGSIGDWLMHPKIYWPAPTFGAVIPGLTFYVVKMLLR